MSRTIFASAALLAALLLLPLDAYAQRGRVAPGARIGAGVGRIGVGVGRVGTGVGRTIVPGRWYAGRWYPGYWRDGYWDDGYYSGTTYVERTYPVQLPYDGPGVAIRNQTDQKIHFTIDDRREFSVGPNETIRLSESPQFLIAFDRGSSFGSTRYTIHEGLYEFTPTERGWELFRQKADNVAARPNENATPRTAERPMLEPLPEGRPFDGEFRDADGDLRDPDLRDRGLPPPVPQADNPADDY